MASIITDTFQDTDGTELLSHVATGPNGGFNWTMIAGTNSVKIINNLVTNDNLTGTREYRAEQDLDSDDQYVQLDVIKLRSSTNNGVQLFIRAENDSRARYSFGLFYASAGVFTYRFRIDDASTGAGDTIQTDTINATTPLTMRMEAVGNNIKCYVDENLIVDYTDESNTYHGTDYRRTGLAIRGGTNPNVSTTEIDNFEAGIIISSDPDKTGEDTFSISDTLSLDKSEDGSESFELIDSALVIGDVVFPDTSWAIDTPANRGVDSAGLAAFATALGTGTNFGGIIIKDGYQIYTWGDITTKHQWASTKKPFYSTLLLFALYEGLISSLDDLVRPYVQAVQGIWAGGDSDLRPQDYGMTFRHLANMTSCYGTDDFNPGEAFIYSDNAISIYRRILFRNGGVFGTTGNDSDNVSNSRLVTPLGMQDGEVFNTTDRLQTSKRDLARWAWWVLNKFHWDGTQLLPQTYFDQYIKNQVPMGITIPPEGSLTPNDYLNANDGELQVTGYQVGANIYGMNFWFNNITPINGNKNWPALPDDAFMALGNLSGNEAYVLIVPSWKLVVVALGNWGDLDPGNASSTFNQNLQLLTDAMGASADPDHQVSDSISGSDLIGSLDKNLIVVD